MNIINKLTIRHLLQNRGRTLITIIAIALSVAMVCAVAGFLLSVRDLLMRTLMESKGDYHIVYIDVTEETAEKIAGEDVFGACFTKPGNMEDLVNIYLRLNKPGRDYQVIARGIADRYEVENWGANNEQLALEGAIAQDNVVMTFFSIAVIAIIVIVAGSIIVIANAFYISASERVRQFGLLKSAGATKSQIGRSIFFEAFLLAVIAIPLGIALGFLIQAVVLWLTNDLLRDLSAMNNINFTFRVVFQPVIIYVSIAIAAVTMLISAWLPARRAAKISPIDAIRQTADIKIRSKQLKTSPLTRIMFGFEGALASKSLKRSRGKYRATVISLTVSIVLFMSMSSLVWIMNKDAQMQYGGYDFDVLLSTTGDLEKIDDVLRLLDSVPDSEVKMLPRTAFETEVPDDFFNENAINGLTDQNRYGLLVHSISDAQFTKIVQGAEDEISGILANTTGTIIRDSKIQEHTPYNCRIGTELPLIGKSGDRIVSFGNVTIAAILERLPDGLPDPLFEGNHINIFVSETTYRELYRDDNSFVNYIVTATDPEAFCQTAEDLLEPYSESFSIWNVAQMTRLNRNIVIIVMLFGYGFIAMLSLIAVTSVVATISTGMALRKQEFAMLFSAGMTPGGMNKMLNLESLLYGVKSLAIGLPIGAALSYFIYMAMGNTIVFAFEMPWMSMMISAAAVMLLTFGTMRYGRRKMKKVSIVESIRSEVV